MKIAYDGMPFEHDWIEGMLVYNRQLLNHLLELYPQHEYNFYFNSLRQDFANVDLPGEKDQAKRRIMRIPTIPSPRIRLKMYFDIALPRYLRKNKIDLFHGLRYQVPPPKKIRIVTTFFDIFALVFPDMYSPEVAAERKSWYKKALDRSDRIISSSHVTKDDIVQHYNIPAEKIEVIHLAADSSFKPNDDGEELQRLKKKYNIDYNFILALGTHPIRKNIKRMLNAMARLVKGNEFEHKLVLFGTLPHQQEIWKPMIRDLGIEDDVRFLYPVPNKDLPALYSMADIFLYPSLYEGFGIPILEAMGCGTPVITSNLSAMPEVAGGAAKLVDPHSIDELTEAIRSLLYNPQKRKKFSKLSLKRSEDFSWEKTARKTMEVYESLI